MTTRLHLICHASTTALRAADFPADEPLDEHGLRKLASLSDRIRADRVWTSPALRAMQTAAALNLAATVAPALRDWEFGRWCGRSMADVHATEPEAVAQWLSDPDAAPHGGEALTAVLGRMAAWLAAQAEVEGSVAAVTHAAPIRAAIISAIAATPQSFWRLDVAPLSVTKLSFSHGRWSLSSLGPLLSRGGNKPSSRAEADGRTAGDAPAGNEDRHDTQGR